MTGMVSPATVASRDRDTGREQSTKRTSEIEEGAKSRRPGAFVFFFVYICADILHFCRNRQHPCRNRRGAQRNPCCLMRHPMAVLPVLGHGVRPSSRRPLNDRRCKLNAPLSREVFSARSLSGQLAGVHQTTGPMRM